MCRCAGIPATGNKPGCVAGSRLEQQVLVGTAGGHGSWGKWGCPRTGARSWVVFVLKVHSWWFDHWCWSNVAGLDQKKKWCKEHMNGWVMYGNVRNTVLVIGKYIDLEGGRGQSKKNYNVKEKPNKHTPNFFGQEFVSVSANYNNSLLISGSTDCTLKSLAFLKRSPKKIEYFCIDSFCCASSCGYKSHI